MTLQVNAWTEWGSLELIVVGSARGMCHADTSPVYPWHHVTEELYGYLDSYQGPFHPTRIALAQAQLDNLANIIQGECIQVSRIKELEKDIGQELERYRSISLQNTDEEGNSSSTIIHKNTIEVWRSPSDKARFDLDLRTPHFASKYQLGLSCPRDVLITLGDTVVEAPTPFGPRYFEATYYKPLLSSLWSKDPNMKWLQPPKASCSPTTMFDEVDYWNGPNAETRPSFSERRYKTNLNESEIAFDAADIMRMGKDVFYKKSATTTIKGLDWLRRTFPHLRFHMVHFPDDESPHIDVLLVPLRPPTSGSEGLVLINQIRPPLASQMKLFTDNDWRPIWCPRPVTDKLPPTAMCSPNLNMNILSLSEKCVIIEECEVPLYRLLTDDLGFDVITCPLRVLNEFGGGVHCGMLFMFLLDFKISLSDEKRQNILCKSFFSVVPLLFVVSVQ
jgi:N-dimethylarginine dimethylaminohydrolase